MRDALHLHNASSVYQEGRAARAVIETARGEIAMLFGGGADTEVIFTSGGTEACNLGLKLQTENFPRLIISATEHAAILQPAHQHATILPVTADGVIDMNALTDALKDPTPALVCVMAANNEVGTLQPLAAISAAVHAHGSLLFCDGVQAAGKVPLNMETLGIDALALSAHKLGGAMGAGALLLRAGISLAPAQQGGGQELGLRAGTENVSGIAAFAAAARLALEAQATAAPIWAKMRDDMEAQICANHADMVIVGQGAPRLPNTSCFGVKSGGVTAETLLMKCDLAGIAISAGAACSSGKIARSHVLGAMGVEEALAASAVRVSFGWQSQPEDGAHFATNWLAFAAPLKQSA